LASSWAASSVMVGGCAMVCVLLCEADKKLGVEEPKPKKQRLRITKLRLGVAVAFPLTPSNASPFVFSYQLI
jgi:hypothetical protein